jgi:serine protease
MENTADNSAFQDILTKQVMQPPIGEMVSGQYIVVLKTPAGIQGAAFNAQAVVAGSIQSLQHSARRYSLHLHRSIKGLCCKDEFYAGRKMSKGTRIAFIEQDQIANAVAVQTNPTWGLDRIDQLSLGLSNSYTYSYTGSGVDVYH